MFRVSGSGKVRTINGAVRVRFIENPASESSFGSLNGTLELDFQPGLSADLLFKTTHGEIWTDFEVEPLNVKPKFEEERQGNTYVLSIDTWAGVRARRGGPSLFFETMNGDILIRNARN